MKVWYQSRKENEMVIKSLELETVCGITSKFPENDKIEMAFWGRSNVLQEYLPSRGKPRRSTIIISMICSILLTCRDMVMPKCPKKWLPNG